jgi:hypothetical protein
MPGVEQGEANGQTTPSMRRRRIEYEKEETWIRTKREV